MLERGHTTITCTSSDGFAKSDCLVTVSYSFWQWILELFALGWLWY